MIVAVEIAFVAVDSFQVLSSSAGGTFIAVKKAIVSADNLSISAGADTRNSPVLTTVKLQLFNGTL